MVADMDLDEFSNSDLFTLRDTIQNNWGDMAYEDSMIPFDQFIRTAIPDAKYYIGNIIYLHQKEKKYEMVIKDLLFLGR